MMSPTLSASFRPVNTVAAAQQTSAGVGRARAMDAADTLRAIVTGESRHIPGGGWQPSAWVQAGYMGSRAVEVGGGQWGVMVHLGMPSRANTIKAMARDRLDAAGFQDVPVSVKIGR